MRTVPTLIATATGTAVSSLGLTIARPDRDSPDIHRPSRPPTRSVVPWDMTALAAYPTVTTLDPAYAAATFESKPLGSVRKHGTLQTPRRSTALRSLSSRPVSSRRASASAGMDSLLLPRDTEGASLALDTPNTLSRSLLRRLSSSVSMSRELRASAPSSRPASAVISPTNASFSLPNTTASSTPVLYASPSSLTVSNAQNGPNKLVKRPPSARHSQEFHTASSPIQGSRLPLPVLRRPATSYQRSALHDQVLLERGNSDRKPATAHAIDIEARDTQFRQYFAPHVEMADAQISRRRSLSISAIPNPIKRVYPDRKYTPVLVSARDMVQPAFTEFDDGIDGREEWVQGVGEAATGVHPANASIDVSAASSPLPVQQAHFDEDHNFPRRSFSISDLLATGPHPLWRRPSSRRSRSSATSRVSERGRPRVGSMPLAFMGGIVSANGTYTENVDSSLSRNNSHKSLHASQRKTYSSPIDHTQARPALPANIEFRLSSDAASPSSSSPLAPHSERQSSLGPIPYSRTPSPRDLPRPSSAHYRVSYPRSARNSASHSELTSTSEAESEQRSTGENSTEYQSDTVYDSIPTRRTRSGSGRRGPHIETIFNDSPPSFLSDRSVKLRDLLQDGQFPGSEHNARYRHSTIDEEESVLSTPVRSVRTRSAANTPSARGGTGNIFASSPPTMKITPDPDEDLNWDLPVDDDTADDDDEACSLPRSKPGTPAAAHTPMKSLSFRFGPALRFGNPATTTTPKRQAGSGVGGGGSFMERANLFDWAEQQPSPSHPNDSPPRPRTVHGKKDQDSRGSRPVGRRGPSGMHARSHSVPVVPDVDGKRSNVVANKFGTWGVGSKAVTEDWNEDFDFDDDDDDDDDNEDDNDDEYAKRRNPSKDHARSRGDGALYDEKRIDSGHEMFVPKSIREQQANVVANIGLLREWGLLIEELKELRIRAVSLDMLNGPYAQAWREVDAMIELADQETEEQTLAPRRSPPSSPGFDYDAFDEPEAEDTDKDAFESGTHDRDSQAPALTTPHARAASPTLQFTPSPTRQRKDSESVARTVIAALQSRQAPRTDNSTPPPIPPTKKLPFDTATLRDIVPYVNGLSRKVKDGLRETEGLYLSPRRPQPDGTAVSSSRKLSSPPAPSHSHLRRRSSQGDEVTLGHALDLDARSNGTPANPSLNDATADIFGSRSSS